MPKEVNPLRIYLQRQLGPGHYTVREAGDLVGKSSETLRRWRRSGFMVPSVEHVMGEQTLYVYTEADIDLLRSLVEKTKRGKPLSSIDKDG